MKLEGLSEAAISSAVFASIGIVVFALAFWLKTKVAPFSVRNDLEDDQNTSLGIIIGSVIIGIALIISAAIHG